MPLAALLVAALVVAAVALGGGSTKKAEPAPKGPGGTPNGGTPPPGVYDDCFDDGMPPELAAQVKQLLAQAKTLGAGSPAAMALADLLQKAGDQAALQGYPKAAACLKQQALALGAGGAGGGVFTIAEPLPEPLRRADMPSTVVTVTTPLLQLVNPGGNMIPGVDGNPPRSISSCVKEIPEPFRSKIAAMMAAGLADQPSVTWESLRQAQLSLQDLGYLGTAACMDDLLKIVAARDAKKAAAAAQAAAFQKAGF